MASNYLSRLNTILDTQLDYVEYQLMRYFNDTSIDIRNQWDIQWKNLGFDMPTDSDLFRSAYLNIIKSVIDSLVSKLANQKVRPYFTSINGTFQTRKVVKAIQQYFDILFDNQDIHGKMSRAFKTACIAGKGYIFVNPITFEIENLFTHQVATLTDEERYGSTREHCMIRYQQFPVIDLKKYGIEYKSAKPNVELTLYFDIPNHAVSVYINRKKESELPYKHDILPLVYLYYNDPVLGSTTTSIVHELDGIQTQIDYINAQISAATQTTPANQTFVLEGSSLKPKDLGNKAGMVYGVKMPAGVNTPPVVSVSPSLFDPQWLSLLEYYTKQAYEIVGISQLSAMSKKPSGLDSGTALQTMEDIESDRFETQVSRYVQAYVDLAKTIIEILPENKDILPQSINNSSLKWKDIKEQSNLFKVQYSAASSLSKDPAEKLKQIMQLSQVGLLSADKISRYLDMPDLEDAYKDASSLADGVQECIERAIEEEDYNVPDWVSYELLAKQITVVENELYSSITGDDENDTLVIQSLQRIRKLEEDLASKMEENGYIQLQQPEEAVQSDSGLGVAPDAVGSADLTSQMQAQDVGMGEADQLATPQTTGNPNDPNATNEVTNGQV